MSRSKLLLVACFAVFAFAAVASVAAFGEEPHWDVNGTPLVGSEPFLPTALVLNHGRLLVPTAGVTIECLGHELLLTNGSIIAPDRLLIGSITFHECEAISTGNCSIPRLILVGPVHGLAELEGKLNVIILLLPETKNVFTTIKFEGETCALLGVQPVTGHVHLLIHEGQDLALLHLVLAFSLVGALHVGSDEAKLEELDFDLALKSHLKWNFL